MEEVGGFIMPRKRDHNQEAVSALDDNTPSLLSPPDGNEPQMAQISRSVQALLVEYKNYEELVSKFAAHDHNHNDLLQISKKFEQQCKLSKATLDKERKERAAENKVWWDKYTGLQQEMSDLQSTNSDLDIRAESLQATNSDLRNQIDSLKKNNMGLAEHVKNLESENNALRGAMAIYHKGLDKLADEESKSCCANTVARLSNDLREIRIDGRSSISSISTTDSGFFSNLSWDISQRSSGVSIERKHRSDLGSIDERRVEKRPRQESLLALDSPTLETAQGFDSNSVNQMSNLPIRSANTSPKDSGQTRWI